MTGLLFEPLQLGAWTLPNRIAMAPMTRSRAGTDDVATGLNAEYYAQRADAGLIIAEAAQITPEAQGYPRTPGIYSDAQVAGWRQVTDAVHKAGGRIVLQLWHVGRISHAENRRTPEPPVAPSAFAAQGKIFTPQGVRDFQQPRALRSEEMPRLAADYAAAARRALAAGFDGVEIHAANGYLIDQFLHASSNKRDDRYGGSIENRCRLLFEICDAVCQAVGADRVGVRLSPFGTFNDVDDPEPEALFAAAIGGLNRFGLAYLHVINLEVTGDRWSKATGAAVVRFARQHYQGKLMAAGGYGNDSAEATLREGQADIVAFGRPFISNPDLPYRLRRGLALAEPQRATFYTEGPQGYTDYPRSQPI